ncbi:glycosyltransferase [Corynebacterium glutamicum]|uniref:glycosyltransferase n=1 Tax=Corynebacterium glutamicum TaxID=1718 RepID=UPI000941CEDE|nr:glycosyltransferase [Corynebacterium glutamicum]OKX86071.1 hypothetical protein AUO96_09560 [Corynebacterium glutamicum]QDX74617.1 hypothetical protein AKL15_02020 [Corynebacterium glutamicum]QDX77379.1 hypothetical protein AKL16_02025 [Corynebacterium glutamicum]TWS34495.1 hypothetical protein AKJ19_08330 [Corynebacterium glutamicum]TWS38049.1 hypothetical protein AKJ20_00325 [Corynebacterium glutamicum]
MTSKYSSDSPLISSNFNVLIAGYINVNVIDGSAFFLAGICGMFAQQPLMNVTLISANPVSRPEVLEEVLKFPNVEVIDPFSNSDFQKLPSPVSGDSMSRDQYAELIGITASNEVFNSIIIRDTETAFLFAKKFPQLVPRLALYVTGISSLTDRPSPDTIKQVEFVSSLGAKLLCQTDDMANILAESAKNIGRENIGILSPHIPDSEGSFDELYHHCENPNRLAYTGKFFKAWNVDAILSGFKTINQKLRTLQLDVAGDQFKRDVDDKFFVDNVRYLLRNTTGVTWHGRVPRKISREIIANSHVGIGWRGAELDSSTELSTKILEYGALARPSILNRTELHERLLGEDYPLFVNSMSEYKNLLLRLPESKNAVEIAARRCYELSQKFTYSAILPQLLTWISPPGVSTNEFVAPLTEDLRQQIRLQGHELDVFADARIDGIWFIWGKNSTSNTTLENLALQGEVLKTTWKFFSGKFQKETSLQFSPKTEVSSHKELEVASRTVDLKDRDSVRKLKDEKESLERALNLQNSRLEALSRSKLGRLQLMYWRKRHSKKR